MTMISGIMSKREERTEIEELQKEYIRNAENYGNDIENTIIEQIPRGFKGLAQHRPFGKIIAKILGLKLEVLPTDILENGFQTALLKKGELVKVFVLMF